MSSLFPQIIMNFMETLAIRQLYLFHLTFFFFCEKPLRNSNVEFWLFVSYSLAIHSFNKLSLKKYILKKNIYIYILSKCQYTFNYCNNFQS